MHHRGITPAFGQWLEAIVHGMEAIDDGHQFRSPEFSLLLELYKDRVYDANIASAAKTTARLRFGGALRRNDRDQDGGGGSRENFRTTRPGREAVAPRATFAKDGAKDTQGVLRRADPMQLCFVDTPPGAPSK
eukprot:jgi/Tetstr1/440837/TSEL_000253.t1